MENGMSASCVALIAKVFCYIANYCI